VSEHFYGTCEGSLLGGGHERGETEKTRLLRQLHKTQITHDTPPPLPRHAQLTSIDNSENSPTIPHAQLEPDTTTTYTNHHHTSKHDLEFGQGHGKPSTSKIRKSHINHPCTRPCKDTQHRPSSTANGCTFSMESSTMEDLNLPDTTLDTNTTRLLPNRRKFGMTGLK
jgi:hypothetical protein